MTKEVGSGFCALDPWVEPQVINDEVDKMRGLMDPECGGRFWGEHDIEKAAAIRILSPSCVTQDSIGGGLPIKFLGDTNGLTSRFGSHDGNRNVEHINIDPRVDMFSQDPSLSFLGLRGIHGGSCS